MQDIDVVMSWLDGLTEDDWAPYHSDSEVQTIAKAALSLLKEQEAEIRKLRLALEGIIFETDEKFMGEL